LFAAEREREGGMGKLCEDWKKLFIFIGREGRGESDAPLCALHPDA